MDTQSQLQPGQYRCVITGADGTSVATQERLLSVYDPNAPPPIISTQPVSHQTVAEGSTATISVIVNGPAEGLSWQWQKKAEQDTWAILSEPSTASFANGVTTITYTIDDVKPSDAGTFRISVTNANGASMSSESVLAVSVPPTITQHPQGTTAITGNSVSFSVSATGGNLTYQWQKMEWRLLTLHPPP